MPQTRNKKMLKAGALFYTIFISFLISLISGFLIIAAYQYNRYIDDAILFEQIKMNANSGIEYFLANPNLINLNEQKKIQLFEDESSWVSFRYYSWGMYSVICSDARWKHFQFSKIALVGDNVFSDDAIALYLANHKNYLSVCGATIIKGTSYLPELGIKRSYIEGKSFTGKKLINGKVKQSDKNLPEINQKILEQNSFYFYNKHTKNDSIIDSEQFFDVDSIINSFTNKTILICFTGGVNISDKTLLGNIILVSDSKIKIAKNNNISDIIIYAPEIEVDDGFTGNLQLFSNRHIKINRTVDLEYPSSVCLFNFDKNLNGLLEIEENATISGSVILYNQDQGIQNHSLLKIGKKSEIFGQVFSNDLVQHEGMVYGSLYADRFFLKTASSVYENQLLDAEIDASKLSKYFVGVNLFESNKTKEVIKWLP